jgi:hypothetical protein
MNLVNAALLISIVILLSFMVYRESVFTTRKRASRNWPTIEATIVGSDLGPQGLLHRVRFKYSYCVNGSHYAGGFYLLAGDTISVKELQNSVVGRKVLVKHDIRRPGISFLVDMQIVGRRVLQGPIWSYR